MIAFVYRCGAIGFGRRIPSGTMKIATGPAPRLRAVIGSLAERRPSEGEHLYVPLVSRRAELRDALGGLLLFVCRIKAAHPELGVQCRMTRRACRAHVVSCDRFLARSGAQLAGAAA